MADQLFNPAKKHYTAIKGEGINLEVDRLPSGKWMLKVNGVEMHFAHRPEFTIPAK